MKCVAVLSVALLEPTTALAITDGDWSGYIAAEGRWFAHSPLDSTQTRHGVSVTAEPQYYVEWADGRQSLAFKPFVRLDSADSERTHVDLRELMWQHVGDSFELRAGVGKVFWGVTEGLHLVDIVNQTDLVESLDGEEKLGQPMVNLALIEDWGTLNLFALPLFRERTFPGVDGRLRTSPRVDEDRAMFDSGAGRGHMDIAGRYSHYFGNVDVGLSHFYGTSREPRFVLRRDGAGNRALAPLYERIHQTGIDLQYTEDAWLWKFEGIRRSGQGTPYLAGTGGFEYTFYGIGDTNADLGIIGEYMVDGRGESNGGVFQNDVLAGLRLALNDEQSTEMLVGVIQDLDNGSSLFSIEGSRRVGDSWKLSLEGRMWTDIPHTDSLSSFRRDDYLQLEIARYF
jgi:hypothetical protein